jgi:hypothetical protein
MATLQGGEGSKGMDGNNSSKIIEQLGYDPSAAIEKANEAFQAFNESKNNVESAATEGEQDYALLKKRSREIDFTQQAGAAPYIINSYTYAMNLGGGNWRNNINNKALVSVVADGVQFQKNLTTTGSKEESDYTMKNKRSSQDMSVEDVVEKETPEKIARDLEKTNKVASVTSFDELFALLDSFKTIESKTYGVWNSVDVKGFINDARGVTSNGNDLMAVPRTFGLRDKVLELICDEMDVKKNPPQKKSGVGDTSAEEQNNQTNTTPKTSEDFVKLSEDALGNSKKQMETPTPQESAPKKRRTPEEFDTLTKMALKRMEGVKETLNFRNEKTRERLLDMGLTGLSKGLESWKNVSPRKKLLIGLTLAGASVASGGLTSFISKGLSTLTYASSHYNEKLKAIEEKGEEIDKRKLAVQSITRGFILAMASSQLMGLLAPHIPEALDVVKEKFSSVKDGVKEWFSSFNAAVPDTGTALTPNMDNSVFPNGFTSPSYTVSVPDSLGAGESLVGPDIMVLPDYVIQPGENITKIIKEQVIKTIPGYQNLTPFQQNNMIENLVKQAALNKGASFYEAINKFADPSKLVPGQTVNLTQIRSAFIDYKFNDFGGKSLLEHARGLGEYASSPSVATTYDYVSSGAPTVSPQPLTAVNPADFGAVDTTPSVTISPSSQSTPTVPEVGSQTNIPPRPLTPQEIIDLNDGIIDRNGAGGMLDREHISEA